MFHCKQLTLINKPIINETMRKHTRIKTKAFRKREFWGYAFMVMLSYVICKSTKWWRLILRTHRCWRMRWRLSNVKNGFGFIHSPGKKRHEWPGSVSHRTWNQWTHTRALTLNNIPHANFSILLDRCKKKQHNTRKTSAAVFTPSQLRDAAGGTRAKSPSNEGRRTTKAFSPNGRSAQQQHRRRHSVANWAVASCATVVDRAWRDDDDKRTKRSVAKRCGHVDETPLRNLCNPTYTKTRQSRT